MMNSALFTTALRHQALFVDICREDIDLTSEITPVVTAFVARLRDNGFCVTEELLHALCTVPDKDLAQMTQLINDILGVELNWAPLVRGWQVPTGESRADHLITLFANILAADGQEVHGTRLPCGHLIPDGTFPLERYNGCPFCGRPFHTADFVYHGQASKLKPLRLFTLEDLQRVFLSLLSSPTPLDATQATSLRELLAVFPFPADVTIAMRETSMLVVQALTELGRNDEAGRLLQTPTDILRYLWWQHTGHLLIIKPRTLIQHAAQVNVHRWQPSEQPQLAAQQKQQELRLHYSRRQCRLVATWLCALPLTPQQAAENMNPHRGMWVRFIRALRLTEYARKPGFQHLAALLDIFYRQDYTTWQGRVDAARDQKQKETLLALLVQRPGLFARCLFSTILRFGPADTLAAFRTVIDKVPPRLLISLGDAADSYFNTHEKRIARPLTGGTHRLEPHPLLALYNKTELQDIISRIHQLYLKAMEQHFQSQQTNAKTIFIHPQLHHIPISVGDRATTIQDTSCALMGTRFPVEGDAVRLFLQWGKGLPAQPLDMDLSCRIFFEDGTGEDCAYFNLTCTGAKHSGDIREIPDQVGTAEYIELNLPVLTHATAQYVVFTCNAYTRGTLSPNLVVGWMNSEYPMQVSNETGVAYDPSCVQHSVRISENDLSKGLIFGVLDVTARQIIWLEMPFTSQTIHGINTESLLTLLHKLQNKTTIGQLLTIKAQAQHLQITEDPEHADERYTYEWALNPAEVAALLFQKS